jgi:hypothetical protein
LRCVANEKPKRVGLARVMADDRIVLGATTEHTEHTEKESALFHVFRVLCGMGGPMGPSSPRSTNGSQARFASGDSLRDGLETEFAKPFLAIARG